MQGGQVGTQAGKHKKRCPSVQQRFAPVTRVHGCNISKKASGLESL